MCWGYCSCEGRERGRGETLGVGAQRSERGHEEEDCSMSMVFLFGVLGILISIVTYSPSLWTHSTILSMKPSNSSSHGAVYSLLLIQSALLVSV